MSSESDSLIVDGSETKEIQLADGETASDTQGSTSLQGQHVVVRVTENKQLLDELESARTDLRRSKQNHVEEEDHFKIQKVPEIMLRNRNYEKHFRPTEMSIGPIYAVRPKLNKKELKLKLAASFMEESGRSGAKLLEEVKSEIKDIRKYFSEEVIVSYTDEKLIELVFLDGCAMLGFVRSYVNQRLKVFNISNGQATLIQQDFFLLENQIPFKVLDVLMRLSTLESTSTTTNLRDDFTRFIIMSSILVPKYSANHLVSKSQGILYGTGPLEKPDHVLDIYRRMLILPSHDHFIFRDLMTRSCCALFCIFISFGALTSCAKKFMKRKPHLPVEYPRNMPSFRNVQELKTTGKLFLPTLVVDSSMTRILLNLIAYETCTPKETKDPDIFSVEFPWVASYIYLLDLLIDNEQDVKDLRAANIIRNGLSSDMEVAQLINNIGSNSFTPSLDTYGHVKNKIEKHYRRRCAIWMAQLCHDHFSSPLTVLALFAATVVLVLTGVQTWYAINPKT